MSKEQIQTAYEKKNTELIRAMGRLSAAVGARDGEAVDVADKEVRKLIGELRALLRVM